MELWTAIVGTVTAISAVAGVIFIAMQWLDRISIDLQTTFYPPQKGEPWDPPSSHDGTPDQVIVSIRIHNGASQSIELTGVELTGIPFAGGASHKEPLALHVPVKGSVDFSVVADPDWIALSRSRSSRVTSPRLWASITMDCSVLIHPLKRKTASKIVSEEIITKNAEMASHIS